MWKNKSGIGGFGGGFEGGKVRFWANIKVGVVKKGEFFWIFGSFFAKSAHLFTQFLPGFVLLLYNSVRHDFCGAKKFF
ncbi:MAG: hypothetical protein ABIG61_08425 [Planctomycetota bacterium]